MAQCPRTAARKLILHQRFGTDEITRSMVIFLHIFNAIGDGHANAVQLFPTRKLAANSPAAMTWFHDHRCGHDSSVIVSAHNGWLPAGEGLSNRLEQLGLVAFDGQ